MGKPKNHDFTDEISKALEMGRREQERLEEAIYNGRSEEVISMLATALGVALHWEGLREISLEALHEELIGWMI